MIQPIDLSLAHFNVERSAQMSKDALAVAQQTGQGKEVVEESVRRTQMVQAGIAAAEPRKVKRRNEDEERERRREKKDQFFSERDSSDENTEPANTEIEEIKVKKSAEKFRALRLNRRGEVFFWPYQAAVWVTSRSATPSRCICGKN